MIIVTTLPEEDYRLSRADVATTVRRVTSRSSAMSLASSFKARDPKAEVLLVLPPLTIAEQVESVRELVHRDVVVVITANIPKVY